jgi:hypothetical protein
LNAPGRLGSSLNTEAHAYPDRLLFGRCANT